MTVFTVRVFRPVFVIHLTNLFHELRNLGQSRAFKEEEGMKWLDSISPVGANPFDCVVTYKTWAGEFPGLANLYVL
jgi:hypothetical protein